MKKVLLAILYCLMSVSGGAWAKNECIVENVETTIEYYAHDLFVPITVLSAIQSKNTEKAISILETELIIIVKGLSGLLTQYEYCMKQEEKIEIDKALVKILLVYEYFPFINKSENSEIHQTLIAVLA